MANLGCGIDSIVERIETIKSIFRKYKMLSAGVATEIPTFEFTKSLEIPLAEWLKNAPGSGIVQTLYDKISTAYNYAKQGMKYIKDAEREYNQIMKDYGTVVSNLGGILQDLKDLTVLDVQVLELDLAKLGLNPGEIVTRLKNGEDLDAVLGDAADKLSETSKALIDKLSKPLSVSIDLTCQKLPNVQIVDIGNVRRVYTLPAKPQANSPGKNPVAQEPAPISTLALNPTLEDYTTALGGANGTYGWQYLCTGHDVPKFYHAFSDAKLALVADAVKKKGNTKLAREITPELVKLNLDFIGKFIIEPMKRKFPTIKITSGWRDHPYTSTGNVSNHSYGAAVDFQFLPSDEHLFKQKENPIKALNDILANINIKVIDKASGKSVKIGRFRLIREYVASNPEYPCAPNRFHLDANFVFTSKGNAYGINPRTKLAISTSGASQSSLQTETIETY